MTCYNFWLKRLRVAALIAFLFTPLLPAYAAETPSGIPLSEIGSRIDELVADYMHESTPGFAIAVVKDGEIIFSRGYGYAEIERQIPVDPAATVFEYGSINKLFVYVSIMQLLEKGLLDLDADIHTYLPADLSRQFNFEKSFTLRDILNHSAGFGEFFFNGFYDAEKVEKEISLLEGLIATQPGQIFEPGTASSYSNFGIALAAFVVSHIGAQDYSDFERANILNPIGMLNTKNQPDWFGNDEFIQSMARGYQPDSGGGFNEVPWWYISIYPAGALKGTAEDLSQLAIALTPPPGESGPLFGSRNTLDLMLSPSYNPDKMRGTHHGFISYDGILPTLGHAGGTQGFNTDFAIVPSQRFGVVLLSNANGGIVFNEKVLDLLLGNSRDIVASPLGNLPDASSVVGNYVMLRRHEGNLMQPLSFIFGTNVRVDVIDENTITASIMGMTYTYRQTEPYVFRVISSGPIGRTGYELRVIMENGSPVGLSMSGPYDSTKQTFSQSMAALAGGAVIAALSIIFFLIMPIIVLIVFLRKKEKQKLLFNHLSTGILLSGTLLTLNNLILILRIGELAPFIPTSLITPHVWINYILLALAILLFIASLIFVKKDIIGTKRKALYFSTISFMTLFIFVLWRWNFFAML